MTDNSQQTLVDELNYVIAKMDDEIATIKQWQHDSSYADAIQRRRDQHYERLCQIDGLTPE
jgi:hypothetical protein